MTKKEDILYGIESNILVECSIQCGKCFKNKSEYNTDEYYFAEYLIKQGWTFREDTVLCNECS